MTKAEFIDVLKRLYPSTDDLFNGRISLPSIARSAVEYLWMNQVPESKDTVELRHQMNHLSSPGYFDFEDTPVASPAWFVDNSNKED